MAANPGAECGRPNPSARLKDGEGVRFRHPLADHARTRKEPSETDICDP